MKIQAYIHNDPSRRISTVYLTDDVNAFTFDNNQLNMTSIKEGEQIPHLFQVADTLNTGFTEQFIRAFVALGAERGIFPEASHRDLIKAEALAEERLEVISHERGQFGSLLDRVLKAGDI